MDKQKSLLPPEMCGERTLAELGERINEEHRACIAAANKSLHHARAAGDGLSEAKAKCSHGTWGDWLAASFEGSQRTAQVYMRIATNWAAIEAKAQSSAHLTLDRAVQLLASPANNRGAEVPATPIDWFLDDGLLNDEHAHDLRKVRQIIGADVLTDYRTIPCCDGDSAAILLYQFRPEDVGCLYRPDEVVLCMLHKFAAYCNENDGKIPEWERIAFWWACLAVAGSFRAGDLALAIHGWNERFCSAVLLMVHKSIFENRAYSRRLYWGAWGDLRHAGVLDFVRNAGVADEWILAKCSVPMQAWGYVYPSQVQRLIRRHEEEDSDLSGQEHHIAEVLTQRDGESTEACQQ